MAWWWPFKTRSRETIQKARNLELARDYLENALRAKSADMALDNNGLNDALEFLKAAREPDFVSRLSTAIGEYSDIAQLGLAMHEKPNDPRFIQALKERGAIIGRTKPLIEQLKGDIEAKLRQL